MKDTLAAGLTVTRRFTVDRARTIGFMGDEARVYSTPMLVQDMEETCRTMLLEHLDQGEDTVGTRVEINHTAPTPEGMWVEFTATVAKIDGRGVTLDITARDAMDEIAGGRHNRFVVDVGKTQQRVAAKSAKAKQA